MSWRETALTDPAAVHQKLMRLGRWLGCHQMPERSFFWRGYQFPMCARCTGIALGYAAGGVLLIWLRLPILVCLTGAAVMFLDWFLQYSQLLPSTNFRRLITGTFCGIGYEHFLVNIFLALWRSAAS